jgi:hypothetical protein
VQLAVAGGTEVGGGKVRDTATLAASDRLGKEVVAGDGGNDAFAKRAGGVIAGHILFYAGPGSASMLA